MADMEKTKRIESPLINTQELHALEIAEIVDNDFVRSTLRDGVSDRAREEWDRLKEEARRSAATGECRSEADGAN